MSKRRGAIAEKQGLSLGPLAAVSVSSTCYSYGYRGSWHLRYAYSYTAQASMHRFMICHSKKYHGPHTSLCFEYSAVEQISSSHGFLQHLQQQSGVFVVTPHLLQLFVGVAMAWQICRGLYDVSYKSGQQNMSLSSSAQN